MSLPPREPWSGIGRDGWDGTVAPDDLRLLSASSVPKALKSEALERWAVTETIARLIDQLPKFNAMVQSDRDAAVNWASQLRFEKREGAAANDADTGTDMHALLESWLRGVDTPADVVNRIRVDPAMHDMANNLWAWFHRFKPVPVLLEQVVYDPANGIAGRLDLVCTFERAPELGTCLVDLKNSRDARTKAGARKRPYADTNAIQLACYRHAPLVASFEPRLLITERASSARIYLLNDAERAACQPMVPIDRSYILQNNPEACRLYPVDSGPAVHRRALEAAGLWRWLNEEAKAAVGEPYVPPIDLPVLT